MGILDWLRDRDKRKIKEKRDYELKRREKIRKENWNLTLNAAKKRFSEIGEEKKHRIHYKEFKTVLEMVYVAEKSRLSEEKWTKEQQEEFNKKFAANLAKCQKDPKFQEEYALYLKLEERECVPTNYPETSEEQRINRMHGEIFDIQTALWMTAPERELKPEDRKLYERKIEIYEKQLNANEKEKMLLAQRAGGIVRI